MENVDLKSLNSQQRELGKARFTGSASHDVKFPQTDIPIPPKLILTKLLLCLLRMTFGPSYQET